MAVSGDYAYIVDEATVLWVFDIHDPTNLSLVGFCYLPGSGSEVVVSGNYAYVADGNSGLRVVDIQNPAKSHGGGFL